MKIIIRKCLKNDLIFVRKSFEELHDYIVSIDPIKRIRKMPGYMKVFFNKFLNDIKNNQGQIYIAEDTGIPVGFIAGFVADKQSDENLLEVVPSQLGIICDIYVVPQYRGQGIGKKLMAAIERDLAEKNCDSIWVNTNDFNINALNLYKSFGYMGREIGLIKKVHK